MQHLRTLLSASVPDQALLEQTITQCSQDNLELGWRLIEKAATEKAMRDIDENLANTLQIRRRHREQTGQPFYDTSIFTSGQRYPGALPPALLPQPKPQGLSQLQLMVYENFKFMPRQQLAAPPQQSGVDAAGNPIINQGGTQNNGQQGQQQQQQQQQVSILSDAVSKCSCNYRSKNFY